MRRHALYIATMLPVILAAGLLALTALAPIDRVRELVFDTFQKIRPRAYDPELPVRIVALDETSLSKLGQWPWPRDVLARLTGALAEAGAAAIAFDVVFGEADQNSPELIIKRLPESPERAALERVIGQRSTSLDQAFGNVITDTPTILGFVGSSAGPPVDSKASFATAGDDPRPWLPHFPGAVMPIKPLRDAARGLGAVNWVPDGDSVIRKVPTVILAGGAMAPSLSIEALRVAQGASTIIIRASNASGQTAFGEETGVNAVKVGEYTASTEPSGEIRLWARPAEPSSWISAASIVDGSFDPAAVQGRLVFVGAVAIGLGDRRTTPVEDSIPGVEVHVQTVEQILTGVTLVRPDWMRGFEGALVLLAGAGLAVFLRRARGHPIVAMAVSLLLPVVAVATSWQFFTRGGLLVDPVIPSLGLLAVTLVATAYHYTEAERRRSEVRGIFGRFVTPAVVERLVESPDDVVLGGEIRPLTILFSDVRDFTTLSESRTPQGVVSLVQAIHTPSTRAVLAHGGTIDKYLGDGMMAFWNAPLADPLHAEHACRAALDIVASAAALQDPPIRLGIGIHTGEACVGNLGSEQRLEYSAMGDAVNLASRVESLSKLYGVDIVVTDATAEAAPELAFVELDRVRVKGRRGVTTLFALHALEADQAFLTLTTVHRTFLAAYRAGDRQRAEAALAGADAVYGTRYARLYAHCRAQVAAMMDDHMEGWDSVITLDRK